MRVSFAFLFAALMVGTVSAQKFVSDGIAVLVNDSIITYHDVLTYVGPARDVLERQYSRQPEVLGEKIRELQQDGTEQLVERQLILHEFKIAGYQFPESIIEDTIQERIKRAFGDRTTLMQTLRAQQRTYETFRQEQRDEILVDAMRRKNIPNDVLISPQKILDYYEGHKTNFAVGDQVKLRIIQLNKLANDNGNAKQLAQDILRKIGEGASFAEMAKIHSDGPQRENGGESGWAEREGLRKELADAAFALKPGERSGIIDLPDSIWLLQLEDKRVARVKPLSEVRDQIERDLRIEEAKRVEKKWITRMKDKAFVRYFPL